MKGTNQNTEQQWNRSHEFTWPAAVKGPGMLGKAAWLQINSSKAIFAHHPLPGNSSYSWKTPVGQPRSMQPWELTTGHVGRVNMGQLAFSKKKNKTKKTKQTENLPNTILQTFQQHLWLSILQEPNHQQDRIRTPLPHGEDLRGISEGHALLVKGALFSLTLFLLQLTSSLQGASNEEWQDNKAILQRQKNVFGFFFLF